VADYIIKRTPSGRYEVSRVRPYRRDIIGFFPNEDAAKVEVAFQQSLDDDKARDRAGR